MSKPKRGITVGQIRKAIKGLPDRAKLHVRYLEVENDRVFVRIEGLEQIDDSRGWGLLRPGVMLTLSLVCAKH